MTKDIHVTPNQHYAQKLFFKDFGAAVKSAEIDGGHVFPRTGDRSTNYDAAGKILGYFYESVFKEELKPPFEDGPHDKNDATWEKHGQLLEFDQKEFKAEGLQETGFVFIPQECSRGETICHVHMFLHSCGGGSQESVIENGARYWGKYAASNQNLILLFPLAEKCWDTTG